MGDRGPENGQFDNPQGIAVDSGGNVYVADTFNSRVQTFTLEGASPVTTVTTSTGTLTTDPPSASTTAQSPLSLLPLAAALSVVGVLSVLRMNTR